MPQPLPRWRALGATLLLAGCLTGPVRAAEPPPENSALDAPLFYQLLIGEIELRSGESGAAYEVILDAARRRPIRHLMINTNGLRLAQDPELARRIASYRPGIEIYLQFDGLEVDVSLTLRGARLSAIKRRALEHLEAAGLTPRRPSFFYAA